MNKLLRDLTDGERTTIRVLLSSRSRGVTAKGAPYLSFVLQDKSGTMDAKYWNVPESALELYQAGMIVDASGDVLSHNHQLQFRIKQLDIVEETVEARSFAQEGPLPVEVLRERIEACLGNIQNENLKRLIDAVYEKYRSDFYEYPAATKNHHDFVGGLATHVLGMLDLAEMLAAQYPILNRDLLITAAICHDIGKTKELSSFPDNDYTDEGQLIGHIVIGVEMVDEAIRSIPDFPVRLANELKHCIIAHHGELEYGSPKKPALAEAMALNLADNADAKMQTLTEIFKGKTGTEWLGYNKLFESNLRRTSGA